MVAGLLLLALAYLAVGQAAVNRSGAQTAADAAALAAAQDERDQLTDQWVKVLRDPAKWWNVFHGRVPIDSPCLRAGQLAVQNDASLNNCSPSGLLKYRVDVQANESVGRSVVPGSENYKSTAFAIAEVQPLCKFTLPDEGAKGDELPDLTCKDDKVWHLKPDDSTGLPKPEDLFDVHLADSPANDQ